MLHAIELENFKAFGKRARIPFAPITLIFGENSSGKSSILQALNLLKQTLESRETEALLLPRTENGIVDLGSFQEMLFDHDLKRTLSIRVESKRKSAPFVIAPSVSSRISNRIALEFSFKRSSLEEEILLDQIGIYDAASTECLAKFKPLKNTDDLGVAAVVICFDGLSNHPISQLKCFWVTKESKYWESEFKWCKENKERIVQELKEELAGLRDSNLRYSNKGTQQSKNWFQERLKSLKDAIKFFSLDSSKFTLENYIAKRRGEETKTGTGLRGFLPNALFQERSWATEIHSLCRSDDTEIFDAAGLAMEIGADLEQTLGLLYPISPFRRRPERWYIFRGTSPQDVGYQGDLLPELLLRRPELVDETNEWLKRLEIDYELEVKPIGTDSGDFFEVRLIDTRRKERVSVALPDVGFGISQLLPFIVQSLVSEKQIISIEQPEVHVHPKLQADLGDLLAAAIKAPRQNQFIVETHSEHLILRLQRLVRKQQIKPEDVSVIYVSRGPEGAKAERLHLDKDGDFIDEWPNGFFLERLREL